MGNMKKPISVIIPVRNEEKYIKRCLRSIVNNDYPQDLIEVYVIDGMSEDATRERIQPFLDKYPYIRLLDNLHKVVPYALNKGIRLAKGDLIIRMDAHAVYPENYFSTLVKWQEVTGADNIGGMWETKPANDRAIPLAIALATSSEFGVGNAYYRLRKIPDEPKEVDTVPFGCYRREVFDEIGLFDEELTRNQDDEFNARLKKHGGKIVLVPGIRIKYFGRENWKKMFRMFYQYGLFKPLVNRKIGSPATIRQFVPPAFTLFLFMAPVCFLWKKITMFYLLFLLLYFIVNLIISLRISVSKKDPRLFFYLPITFFLIHLGYGLGYWAGILKLIFKKPVQEMKINR